MYILATLRHFDSKVVPRVKIGPLIPCERRRSEMEISEFQEVISEPRLEMGTMTGLMDTFCRHFVVLTNFTEYGPVSRPYWPGGGIPGREGLVQGGTLQGS